MIVMDAPDTEINHESLGGSGRSPKMLKVLAAAALILVVVGVLYAITGDEQTTRDSTASPTEAEPSSKPPALTPDEAAAVAVIEAYEDAYNSGDLDAVMDLFREQSTIVGHPIGGKRDGLVSIRALHDTDMNLAAVSDAYAFSNFEVIGNTVTWDHRWTDSDGEQWCAEGHSAVVENGSIISWTWADPMLCE